MQWPNAALCAPWGGAAMACDETAGWVSAFHSKGSLVRIISRSVCRPSPSMTVWPGLAWRLVQLLPAGSDVSSVRHCGHALGLSDEACSGVHPAAA